MKMHRGPRSADTWSRTDEKSVVDYATSWRPGRALRFDGTIDKSGTRHTDLGVEVEEQDIIELHSGLLNYYRACIEQRDSFSKTIDSLETALARIARLASWEKSRAPDTDSLLAAVKDIADHFGHSWSRDEPFKPSTTWLQWQSL